MNKINLAGPTADNNQQAKEDEMKTPKVAAVWLILLLGFIALGEHHGM